VKKNLDFEPLSTTTLILEDRLAFFSQRLLFDIYMVKNHLLPVKKSAGKTSGKSPVAQAAV
jgi:hypothetical protein